MASKRHLKKQIKEAIYEIVGDAYSEFLMNPKIEEDKIDEIIDNASDILNDLVHRTSNLPVVQNGKDLKEHFNLIKQDFEQEVYNLQVRINQLSA